MQLARVVGAAIGVAAAIATTTLVMALPASAHTPTYTAKCEDGKASLTVKLKDYIKGYNGKSNHVTVTVDGKSVEDKDFDRSFEGTYSASGDVPRKFLVIVTAQDDKRFNSKYEKEVPSCVKVVPSTSSTTTTTSTTTSTSTTTTTTTPTETTTTTTTTAPAVVPVADTDELASTGASIAIPLVIGVVLLGGGGALLFVLRRRANRI